MENLKPRNLYLAHPFDSKDLIREWQLNFQKKTKINLINPFYDIKKTISSETDMNREDRYEQLNPKKLINRDVRQIQKNDGIVAIIDNSLSYGTIQEMVYAKFYLKPVYSVISNGHHKHPWLVYHSTKIFQHLNSLENYFNDIK